MGQDRDRGVSRGARWAAPIAAALAAAACALPATAEADHLTDTSDQVAGTLNVPWPDLLPALPTTANPQPSPVPGCERPTVACIAHEITQLRTLRTRPRCEHRAPPATPH